MEKSCLRDQGKPKKQKEDSEVHVREITSNGFHGKALVCRSDYDHEHELPTAIPSGGGHDSRLTSGAYTVQLRRLLPDHLRLLLSRVLT